MPFGIASKSMTLREKFEMMSKMGKRAVIYCDMDGVLAQWDKACTFELTFEKDYFYNLLLEPAVKEALQLLIDAGFEVSVLSAAYEEGHARIDKSRWLEKYGMKHFNRLYTVCGENKADFIDVEEGVTYILLDDYNPNLINWDATNKNGGNFVAVKFLNGINGGTDAWKGRTIYHRSSGETIAHTLADFAIMA